MSDVIALAVYCMSWCTASSTDVEGTIWYSGSQSNVLKVYIFVPLLMIFFKCSFFQDISTFSQIVDICVSLYAQKNTYAEKMLLRVWLNSNQLLTTYSANLL